MPITAAIFSVIRELTEPPSFLISPSMSSFDRLSFVTRTNFNPSNDGGRIAGVSDLKLNVFYNNEVNNVISSHTSLS